MIVITTNDIRGPLKRKYFATINQVIIATINPMTIT